MKKIIFLIFFLLNIQNTLYAENKIAYVDINQILNNSKQGKDIISKLDLFKKNEFLEIKKKENELKLIEKKILFQKNILKEEEFNKRVLTHKNSINEFLQNKKKLFDERNNLKNLYTKKFIEFLNPILTGYVENNSISVLLQKNNILIGKKSLDVTEEIIKIVNKKKLEIN